MVTPGATSASGQRLTSRKHAAGGGINDEERPLAAIAVGVKVWDIFGDHYGWRLPFQVLSTGSYRAKLGREWIEGTRTAIMVEEAKERAMERLRLEPALRVRARRATAAKGHSSAAERRG